MPSMLFIEAFGQILRHDNLDLEGIVSDEEDLYSVFRARGELMGWSTLASHRTLLWLIEEAELAAGIDASRIGCVQVGLDVGDYEQAQERPHPPGIGFHYVPLAVHRRDIEPAPVLPALIKCFVDALRRFGVVELSGLQVTANFLKPGAQPYAGDINAMLSWFNTTGKSSAEALIAFDEEFLGGHTEAELVDILRRKNSGTFEFGPVVSVPEQHSVKPGDEWAIQSISPAHSGLGISVAMPEWTASAAGWVLARVVDTARLIQPDVSNFAVRLTRVG